MPALHHAARKGDHEMAALLIAKGADVNLLNLDMTPLDYASPYDVDSADLMAKKKKTADLIREHGGGSGAKLSIHAATRAGNVEDIKRLLADGADVNAIENGLAPVHIAASGGNVEIAVLLINGGANVKAMTMRRWTPLHYAVWNGNLKMLEFLIDSGAIARLEDANGMVNIPGGMVQGLFTPVELALRPPVGGDVFWKCPVLGQIPWSGRSFLPRVTSGARRLEPGKGGSFDFQTWSGLPGRCLFG